MGVHAMLIQDMPIIHDPCESARLKALQSYHIWDSPCEPAFDAIAAEAARACGCAMAVINLWGAVSQWVKACAGIPAEQAQSLGALGARAVHGQGQLWVMVDTHAHAELARHPLVQGDPWIRSCIGAPLVNPQGHALGVLMVMDAQVHEPTPAQLHALQALAQQTIELLEMRRQKVNMVQWLDHEPHLGHVGAALSDSDSLKQKILDLPNASADAMWDWDIPTDTLRCNDRLIQMLNVPQAQMQTTSLRWQQCVHPLDQERVAESLQAALDGPCAHWSVEYRFCRVDQSYLWVLSHGFILRNHQGVAIRVVGNMVDIHDAKEAALQVERDNLQHNQLLQVQQRLSSLNMPLQTALQLVAQTMLTQTQASGATIELLEDDDLVTRASVGDCVSPVGSKLNVRQSLIWPTLTQGRSLVCNDTDSMDWDMGSVPHCLGVLSIISAPLRAEQQTIGVIRVVSSQKNAFSPRHVAHMEILATSLEATIQLRNVADQLALSEQQYRNLFQSHPYPMWVYDSQDQRILAVNEAMLEHYGYSAPALLGKTTRQLLADAATHPDPVPDGASCLVQHVTHDGRKIDVEIIEKEIVFDDKRARQVFAVDVTERLNNQRELVRMGRAQKLLSACNETLMRATNETDLLKDICNIAIHIGGYRMGWVGFAMDDDQKTIAPVAQAGNNPQYLDGIHISWSAASEKGRGPAGTVIRTGKPVIIQDVTTEQSRADWVLRMKREGVFGVICLPLQGDGATFGILYLYAPEVLHLSAQESDLLQELANDLAFGIMSLRAQKAQKRLQDSVFKMAAAVSASTGTEFFVQLARNMAEATGGSIGCVAQLLPSDSKDIPWAHFLGVSLEDEAALTQSQYKYSLRDTPSIQLLKQKQYIVKDAVSQIYPLAPMIQSIHARGYAGQQLCNSAGEVIGIVFVVFKDDIQDIHFVESTLKIFAARAAAEMNREIADAHIRNQASWLDKAQDAIVVMDSKMRITFWNKSAERLYGWTQFQTLGQPNQTILYKYKNDFHQAMQATLEHGEWTGEIFQLHRDGHDLEVESRWTLIPGERGESDSILVISNDIGQRKATEREIQRLAFYDPLTELPNRMLLMDRMGQALLNAQRYQKGGALFFIDMDNFKTLNDTLGHDQGDLLLQQVAQRLNQCVRAVDTVARLGGDEFVVMLEDLGTDEQELADQARIVAEKIVAMLAVPYTLGVYQYRSTPSMGIAPFDARPTTIGNLLKQADLAMYQAKSAGRNTFRFFNPDMQLVVSARAELESDLRLALTKDEFLLHYQIQVDAAGRCIGAEALLRWQHPEKGMVPPGLFIDVAEETGLILSIGRWVLHTACKMLAAWQQDPDKRHLTMAVNVSSRQFKHEGFVEDVARVLAITEAPASQLKLELTESMLVEDMNATIAVMTALKEYGVCFSLDDFGTGYSSLSYLRRMPLDQLKIDQSFVRELSGGSNDAVIVNTIIGLSRSLGLEVIAEGVETAEQHALLTNYGCRLFQGYFFGRPVPASTLLAYLNANRRAAP